MEFVADCIQTLAHSEEPNVGTSSELLLEAERLSFGGRPFDTGPDRLGQLVDSSPLLGDPTALQNRFHEDGYLYIPGFHDPELVMEVRRELLLKFATVGEVDDRYPLLDGIEGDRSGLAHVNMRTFTESLRTGARYEQMILHPRLISVVGDILDGPIRPYDFRWPRLARPGEGCGYHCDGPYMSRGTDRHLSVWTPIAHIEPHEGGLMILEDSHQNPELHDGYLKMDADRDGLVWLDDDPIKVQERYGSRWLTATFAPGDILIFSMNTLHGAFDNNSPERRCRLSTDSRYLVDGEVPDPRWNGDDLAPHGPGRVFYPGLGNWMNEDFQDEWKYVDEFGRLKLNP
jgi:hypothetical protein